MQLTDKVALITGAGSGIAKATAILFAQQGAKVAALGRTQDEIEATVTEINKASGEAIPVIADISKASDMQQATTEVINKWGRLDIVFANAGINGVWAPIDELEVDEWDKTIEINLRGTFLTVKYAVPHLKKQGGSIIITSSINGTRTFSKSGATAYGCSKAAQVAFAKMTALELAKHKIRVNVICPGAIDTNISASTEERNLDKAQEPAIYPEGKIPLTDGEPGSSEQVAQLVLFLASDASNLITGTEVWIDGGESLLKG